MAVYDLPGYAVGNVRFWLQRRDLRASDASGRNAGVQQGFPLWLAEYEAVALTDLDTQLWTAWVQRQRGAIHQFRATDPARWLPYAYRPRPGFAGGLPGGWNGDASTYSLSGDRSVLTLTIPSGIVVTPGDLVGFRWSSNSKLALTAAMTGGTSSGTLAIDVDPAVPTAVPTAGAGGTAYLYKAAFLARLMPDTEIGALSPDGQSSIKLTAMQDIVP